jgi:hypothetical protein
MKAVRPANSTPYYTAGNEHEFVLFRIGMRFNGLKSWRGIGEFAGAFARMPLMLIEQQSNPAIGMLSSRTSLSWPNIEITQFWRSYEDLNTYASARDRKHAPAWGWWNALAKSGTVGIWHETYRIAPGSYESIYGFMPAHGLAKATNFRPLAHDEARSKKRMEKPVAQTYPVAHAG